MTTPRLEGGLRLRGCFEGASAPDRPQVSIITVCYNSERHLEQTILSVLGQSYDNIEYILVDGGSTDGSLDIIRRYDDHVAFWVSEPDDGIYDAMNKGIALSTGDIVGMLNSNDYYPPDAVERVVEASLEDEEASIFHGRMVLLNEKDDSFFAEYPGTTDNMLSKFGMNHPTCFVRRRIYDGNSFRTRYRVAADYDLMLRLHLAGEKFHHIDRVLAYFRVGGESSTYYRPRVEIYMLRRENGLLSAPVYFWKRATLVAKVGWRNLKQLVVNVLFKGDREDPRVLKYVDARDFILDVLKPSRRRAARNGGKKG